MLEIANRQDHPNREGRDLPVLTPDVVQTSAGTPDLSDDVGTFPPGQFAIATPTFPARDPDDGRAPIATQNDQAVAGGEFEPQGHSSIASQRACALPSDVGQAHIETQAIRADVGPIPIRRGRKAASTRAGHGASETQLARARAGKNSGGRSSKEDRAMPAAGRVVGGQLMDEVRLESAPDDARFSDPLILEIVQAHRMRRRWLKARNALILQGKAFGRALVPGGDKEAGSALFDRVRAGTETNNFAVMAIAAFLPGIERFDEELGRIEKELERLAKRLPVAAWVKSISGFGFGSLAAIVGECGDLSQYRTVSGIWKRAGLAVIDGERQRKCADKEKALRHGYSPARRSILWNCADAMAKHQRTWLDKETGAVRKPAGPYGEILEREKAAALAKGWPPMRAEAHGKRLMTKELLADLRREWRAATGRRERPELDASPPAYQIAAE